jgi:two-component system alkaline phosphatase synthesis response regulator PhoP
MDKPLILVVEDEKSIRAALVDFLEFHGFAVAQAADGHEAEKAVKHRRYDLILLDLMLPKVSGEELCTRWRRDGLNTPVIMLTAKGQEKDRVNGLDIGADDYITKPFSLEELLARMKAILRRTDPQRKVGTNFSFGGWEVDAASLTIAKDGVGVAISKRESQMIQYFAANPNRVISREELYEAVWDEHMSELGTRTTDMHIVKLRDKIEADSASPQIIKTVRGAGYKYEPETGA